MDDEKSSSAQSFDIKSLAEAVANELKSLIQPKEAPQVIDLDAIEVPKDAAVEHP